MPAGMPTMMSAGTFEYVIAPDTTYILADSDVRRIFTDGRPWPTDAQPTYQGFSIGKWIDEHGDGVYDVLEVETRGPFKGPRTYDASGLPLHFDNESTFKERIHLDKTDPNILHDLAKSYLQWGLTGPLGAQARTLIDNIANPAAAGVPVLMRASAVPPAPGEDTTGGYLVYLGRRTTAEAILGGFKADDHEPAGILPGSADLRRRRPAAA